MALITKTKENGFDFEVLNGGWHGFVEKDDLHCIFSDQSSRNLGPNDFKRVIFVSHDEYAQWYMHGTPGAKKLIGHPGTPESAVEEDTPVADQTSMKDRFFEAQIVVTILGVAADEEEFEAFISSMELADLEDEMTSGTLAGATRNAGVSEVDPGQLAHRLNRSGTILGDAPWLDGIPRDTKVMDGSDTISLLRSETGWNETSMAILAEEFIRKNGLEHAFVAHLENQARAERDTDFDMDGPL